MAGKRQKLEVIRRPPTCKVEVDDEAHADSFRVIPQQLLEEEEDEEDEGADDKLDEDEDEEEDDAHQKTSFAALSTSLVASPVYPNAVKWSDDNLIAIATSQLITILNPALMDGPRGFVTASSCQSFVVGTVQYTDTDAPCLLPIRLSKDVRAVVRSLDWSPQGLAPNGGCLLVVCTRDHRVKLYRAPHCEYQCEWIQISDVSEVLYGHHLTSGSKATQQGDIRPGVTGSCDQSDFVSESARLSLGGATSRSLTMVPFGSSLATGINPRSVVDAKQYVQFTNVLAYVSVAWSPAMPLESLSKDSLKITTVTMALLALGAKSGDVSVLKCIQPANYSVEAVTSTPDISLVTIIKAHASWVSALAWSKMQSGDNNQTTSAEEILMVTGSTDGSVKLWVGKVLNFSSATTCSDPLTLLRKVVLDHAPVTSVALTISVQSFGCVNIAVGKASGSIIIIEAHREEDPEQEAFKIDAHSQIVTGLLWSFDGRCLYSCGQDNSLHAWKLNGRDLLALPFPEEFSRKTKRTVLLPDSILDGYYGLCLSKGSLALATLRGVSAELLDQMYESRAVKAVAQVFWIGSQQFDPPPLSSSLEQIQGVKGSNLERGCIHWESNLLAALHRFENANQKLVLWDITAYFMHTSSVMGKNYVNSVILRWLLSLGLLYSDGEDHTIASTKSCKESIMNASCRRLQTVFAILKRLFFAEGHDPFTIMDKLSFKNSSESRFETYETSWQSLLLDVEHELRERLVHLTITSALLTLKNGSASSTDDELVNFSGVLCMLQWIATNSSRVSLKLSNDAQILAQTLQRAAIAETCSTCKAKVPFLSVDMGVCEGDHPHKLPRCSVTLQLCSPGSHWFCYCCARWASKQTPRIFFTSSSRHSLIKLDSFALIVDVEPTCPYCGILMQRYFPDCFLRLSLV